MNLEDLKFTKEHEWVFVDAEGTAIVGISEHASDSLGDVVFVDLPEIGDNLEQFGKLGEIESVKAFSELFSPVSGQVVCVNSALVDAPDLVNGSPYERGWMVRIGNVDTSELSGLMTVSEYESFLSGLVEN